MNPSSNTRTTSRLGRGWQLTKSSWQVLKLDKELASLPLIGFASMLVLLVPLGIIAALHGSSGDVNIPGWLGAAALLLIYFVLTLISNFFGAAIIYGAYQRFMGNDPTIRSSLGGAGRKFWPLAAYSLMAATIGLVLQTMEERLPLVGKITAYILDGAWSIATIFAVPVIVLSDSAVQPVEAVRKSVAVIRKTWGENIIANFGIGLVSLLSFVAYIGIFFGAAFGLTQLGVGSIVLAPLTIIGAFGLMVLILTLTALSGIAKAALYYYATTGETPHEFNRELLATSMTPKKARRIFG